MTDIDIADLRAKAEAATPGPRMWTGNAKYHNWRLSTWKPGQGQWTVMDFQRAGMQNAEPRFNIDGWMHPARELPVFEVCQDATNADDPRVYRHDVVGIRHPDAEFIAAMSPDVVLALLDRITELEQQVPRKVTLYVVCNRLLDPEENLYCEYDGEREFVGGRARCPGCHRLMYESEGDSR